MKITRCRNCYWSFINLIKDQIYFRRWIFIPECVLFQVANSLTFTGKYLSQTDYAVNMLTTHTYSLQLNFIRTKLSPEQEQIKQVNVVKIEKFKFSVLLLLQGTIWFCLIAAENCGYNAQNKSFFQITKRAKLLDTFFWAFTSNHKMFGRGGKKENSSQKKLKI